MSVPTVLHPDQPVTLDDLVARLAHEVMSIAAVRSLLDPQDRQIVDRAVADAADAIAPALDVLRASSPNLCVSLTVDIGSAHQCDHEVTP